MGGCFRNIWVRRELKIMLFNKDGEFTKLLAGDELEVLVDINSFMIRIMRDDEYLRNEYHNIAEMPFESECLGITVGDVIRCVGIARNLLIQKDPTRSTDKKYIYKVTEPQSPS